MICVGHPDLFVTSSQSDWNELSFSTGVKFFWLFSNHPQELTKLSHLLPVHFLLSPILM
jgi:hypothetical protein